MPEDAFLRDEVVITPEQALQQRPEHGSTQIGPGDAPATVVLAHAAPLRDLMVDVTSAEPAPWRAGPAEVHVSREYPDTGVCWPGVGAPAAALVLEKLIAAGTRRVFSLGFAGAIAPNADTGEVCLVTEAVPNDGLTSHYAGPGYVPRADAGLTRTIGSALQGGREGAVWTTDAPYRETVEATGRMRDAGVLAVDMETGAVLTIAAYRGLPAAAMVVTTDVLRGSEWVPCPPGAVDDAVRDAVRAVVAVMKGLRNLT